LVQASPISKNGSPAMPLVAPITQTRRWVPARMLKSHNWKEAPQFPHILACGHQGKTSVFVFGIHLTRLISKLWVIHLLPDKSKENVL
jgi:hypothetical protein